MALLVNTCCPKDTYTYKEKSRTMKNIFSSPQEADYQKLFQLQVTIQKNVLYITHRVDLIIRELKELKHDKDLQNTVDKYFDETSHQTDSDEQ